MSTLIISTGTEEHYVTLSCMGYENDMKVIGYITIVIISRLYHW